MCTDMDEDLIDEWLHSSPAVGNCYKYDRMACIMKSGVK